MQVKAAGATNEVVSAVLSRSRLTAQCNQRQACASTPARIELYRIIRVVPDCTHERMEQQPHPWIWGNEWNTTRNPSFSTICTSVRLRPMTRHLCDIETSSLRQALGNAVMLRSGTVHSALDQLGRADLLLSYHIISQLGSYQHFGFAYSNPQASHALQSPPPPQSLA